MVSELCSNGDLFDYIRNEKAASLNRVVRHTNLILSYIANTLQ